MKIKYQDYVIKNGKFVGKFEEMYKNFSDPWNLLKTSKIESNLNYDIIFSYCDYLKKKKKLTVLEIGCGFAHISNQLSKNGFKVYGTDISETVIKKSKKKYPKIKNNLFHSDFLNFQLYEKLNPDIIILSNISWYVLPKLKKFIKWFKSSKKKVYLIHTLTLYNKNKQKYGRNFFTDLKSIKSFFKLKYLSYGAVSNNKNEKNSFFLGVNK
jgi:SAM-dependent methyltransferase